MGSYLTWESHENLISSNTVLVPVVQGLAGISKPCSGYLFSSLSSGALLLLYYKKINNISPSRAVGTCLARMYWQACDRNLSIAAAVLDLTVILGNEVDATTGPSVGKVTSDPNTFGLERGCLDPPVIALNMAEGAPITGLRYHRRAGAHNTTKGRVVAPLQGPRGANQVRGYRSQPAVDVDMLADRWRET